MSGMGNIGRQYRPVAWAGRVRESSSNCLKMRANNRYILAIRQCSEGYFRQKVA